MEAILLVGGLGTRLRPLTENIPKPLLPVAGVPLVVHQIARLRDVGIDHVVLATSYRAETFTEALGDGSALGVRVDYAVEEEPLGTGGAIRNASRLLRSVSSEPVVIGNADIIDGHDLRHQIDRHQATDADVTLYLTRVTDPRAYGCVPTDGEDVIDFIEKSSNPVTDQINAGCYVFSREAIEAIPADTVVSVERETFPSLLKAGKRIIGVVDDAYWRDLGTPESYVRGCADVVLGRVETPVLLQPAGEAMILDGADVHPGAVITNGACIGPGVTVADQAKVDGSVVMRGARIGLGASITASAIGEGAVISDGVVLANEIVADHAVCR